MFVFSRAFFVALSLFVATISSFAKTAEVRLVEVKGWRELGPSKTGLRFAEGGEGLRDPLFSRQMEMFDKTGMTRLWDKRGISFSRIRGLKVIIIDTGVDCSHPDLVGRVDRSLSRTFIEGGGDPCTDEWGHGTAVTTTGFATGYDGVGMAGFAWNSDIISLKVMRGRVNEFGQLVLEVSLDAIIQALRYAKELADQEGLMVVVTSFSVDKVDPVLNEVLAELEEQNKVFIVAATDNVVLDSKALPGLPCSASTRKNVLCVASLTMEGFLAPWSAYGERVTYTARCDGIVASFPGPRYSGRFVGNSGCAPQVGGLASMVGGYVKERGIILFASDLQGLMLRGGAFAEGLVSAVRQQEILHPITLDAYKLFEVTDEFLASGEPTLKPLTRETAKVSGVSNGSTLSVTSELQIGLHYRVAGQGFGSEYALFLNGVRLPADFSSESAEFILGSEATFFGGGFANVLYLARVNERGEIDPFSVVKILTGFRILYPVEV